MLEGLFGNPVIEKILFTLLVSGDAYPLGLAKILMNLSTGFNSS